jgi:hypothetical protein
METIDETLQCSVCIGYATNAVECSNCSNIFCESCVQNIKCPLCRETVQYKPSFFARKLISNLPANCPNGCTTKLTIGTVDKHLTVCSNKDIPCNQPGCVFKAKSDDFIKHIVEQHKDSLLKLFDSSEKPSIQQNITNLDIFSTRMNGLGNLAVRGHTGRFYCGKKSDIRCNGCDGNCGPDDGCNCSACLKLDIEFHKLSKQQMLNHEGIICELVENAFYCGRKYNYEMLKCAYQRGQCEGCKRMGHVILALKKLLPDHFN